jgi:hypothetical protein
MAAQDYEQLSYNSADGSQWGSSATEKVAMHGATPTVQSAVVTAITVTGYATGLIGFGTSAQFIAATDAINSILVCLKAKGLMAS